MEEVFPLVGVGLLRFGMTPSQIASIRGPDQQYEEWMGGNLNNFMFYRGILIGFDGDNPESPTESSKVVMFQVRCDAGVRLFGAELNDLSKSEALALFQMRRIRVLESNQAFVRIPSLGMQLDFGSRDLVESIYLQWRVE